MRGKLVGSYKPPAQHFGVWPESGRFVVVAPSRARISRHDDLESAQAARDAKQAQWDRLVGRE
jgi:hypothetical protein